MKEQLEAMKASLPAASDALEAQKAREQAAAQARINRQRKADKAAADAEANQRFKALLKQWLLYAVAVAIVAYTLYQAWEKQL